MIRNALMVLAFIACGAATAENYSQQEATAMVMKIPSQPPEMLTDLIRHHGLTVRAVMAGDADSIDIENGFRRGDVIISIMFNDDGIKNLPCDFKTRPAGRLAEFIKRGRDFIPESDLAKWMRTGKCPSPTQ